MALLGFIFFVVVAFLIVKLFYSMINNIKEKQYFNAFPKVIVLLYLLLQLFNKIYK